MIKELPYHDLLEFELVIRKSINPILVKLGFYVNRKDLISTVMNGIIASVNRVYSDSNNKQVGIFLDSIADITESILDKINNNSEYKYYMDKLHEILDIKLDYNLSNEEIHKLLINVYSKLFKLESELDEEIKIDNYKIRIKK